MDGSPLRILHLNTERTWRGGEQQLLSLAIGQQEEGDRPEIVCPPGAPLATRAREDNLPVTELPMRSEADLLAVLELDTLFRERKPDVVHLHTPHAHTLGVLGSKMAGEGVRVVHRRVDFSIYRNSFLGLNRLKYTFGVDRIISISNAIREVLIQDGIPPKKISVVPSSIDPRRVEGVTPLSKTTDFGLPEEAIVIGQTAALADHKGQRYLLDAVPGVLKKHPNAHFLIAGEGKERKALEQQIRDLGIGTNVRLLGFRKDALSFLKMVDLFCLSSHMEGMGSTLFEALLLERPVVATKAGGVPEVIRDGVDGLLVPIRDPAGLSEGILSALSRMGEMGVMAKRGKARVEETFSVRSMVRATRQVYLDTLDRRTG